ncbi:MAG: alpha-mannosidase [Spirochaetaceae bacterium]|jgi:alpha-mannosidase|nr:alpha-mannosidase [Spirochaetaceae bacterium]
MLTPKIEQRISQYLRFLKPLRYRVLMPLEFEMFETEETMRAPPEHKAWEKITTPCHYGKAWHCSWFRSVFRSPTESTMPLFLRVVPNTDSLVFIDGEPAGAFNPFHKKIKIQADGREHILHIESYAGHPFPGCNPLERESIIFTLSRQVPDYPNTFEGGALVLRVEPIYSLYYDARALFELSQTVEPQSLRRAKVLKGLYEALTGIHFESTGETLEAEAAAAALKIAPLLAATNGSTAPDIYLIGHAHIDHAWLWHIGETERKIARTFINMTRLISEYPEFIFIQTQPAQLEIIKQEYPAIFSAIKEAYQKGNWEPNGGMWVEADCNIPSGEALIRQFLVGKGATREIFDYEADTLWLPDVFGYAAALPQILAGCRIRYFVTSKINWNDTTRFPYDTFLWRGIDGTPIKTHFISSRTQGYNGAVSPASLTEIWHEVQHKELQSGAVKSIGEGDGGGGTTRGCLEMARRLRNAEGIPRSGWKKVSEALDCIFSNAEELPEWRGELYLELHRGTYTSQARTKRYNRKLEFALRRLEMLCVVAALEGRLDCPPDLLAAWKVLLTHQFHDIIPGSSIHRVYVEAEEAYRKLTVSLEQSTATLLAKLAGDAQITVFNDLSWERTDPLLLPGSALGEATALSTGAGELYPVQRYRDLDDNEVALCAPRLPALSCTHFSTSSQSAGAQKPAPFVYKDNTLTTPFYRLCFDSAGRIVSLIVLAQNRELVSAGGCFNRLISAQDLPVLWEAWDIDADWTRFITEETRLVDTAVSAGALCFRLRRTYRIGTASELIQDSVFYADQPRIDFETKVSWHERRTLLKVGFDTAFDATEVRCEVQYGHIMRTTTRNLPHDRAKFEICAHKWICLEDAGGGLALLNDCKYGHDVCGGSLRLTLLRAPTAPDPDADYGEQRFTYALMPFAGSFSESPVVRTGYELNIQAAVIAGEGQSSAAAAPAPLFTVEGNAVIAESIKLPQTDQAGRSATIVIRLYESLGGWTQTVLHFCREISAAYETDMLEGGKRTLGFSGKDIALDFRGFEIKTLMVTV